MQTCNDSPRQAFPARYIVPARDTDPLLSATPVTVGPVVAFWALRRPCTGGYCWSRTNPRRDCLRRRRFRPNVGPGTPT